MIDESITGEVWHVEAPFRHYIRYVVESPPGFQVRSTTVRVPHGYLPLAGLDWEKQVRDMRKVVWGK